MIVPPRRDRPVFEHVIGVSLGATATMRFRRRRPVPRSIYHLTGEARHQWEHNMAEMEMTRWSILRSAAPVVV